MLSGARRAERQGLDTVRSASSSRTEVRARVLKREEKNGRKDGSRVDVAVRDDGEDDNDNADHDKDDGETTTVTTGASRPRSPK